MLSVILYGRYDNHGYNYHKRLAISLNCIAEALSGPTDEIIFVDYNTPNELPTIVEAIQDTLTSKAKNLLRVLRVRPSQHPQQTILPLLEPVARNVGIYRSNPQNKWILSTNVDMIFVPTNPEESLTQIVSKLEDGFYSLPRFELPENFWEILLQRSNPNYNISFLRENSKKLHLDTIVRKEGFLRYDNPGDFQLMLRKDIFEMGGFDEKMVKGWHVDSNLCKRMALLNKEGASLEPFLKGYHCNHTQKESFLHSQSRTQNDWGHFVDNTPVFTQKEWGLPNEKIEEISLNNSHLHFLLSALKNSPQRADEILIYPENYNCFTYSPSRIFTYLADHLCNLPEKATVAYIGTNMELISLLSAYIERLSGQLICNRALGSQVTLFIFDFGLPEKTQKDISKVKQVMKCFLKIIKKKISPETKFIGINASYTDFSVIFSKHLSVRASSHLTGISYGYLQKSKKRQSGLLTLRYLIVRYLFNYSGSIHRFILKSQRLRRIFK